MPTSATSREKAELRIGEDGTVLATGKSPAHDVYELDLETDLQVITAIRLEALAHDESPGGGVGRASHNNIVLTDVSLQLEHAGNPGQWQEVELASASADWAQQKFAVAKAIDDDKQSGWAIAGGAKADRVAIFAPHEPLQLQGPRRLRLRLAFESQHNQHTIGKLRLSVSSASEVVPARLAVWQATALLPAENGKAAYLQMLSTLAELVSAHHRTDLVHTLQLPTCIHACIRASR